MAVPHKPLGDQVHHYWLVQRMAARTGADLVAATQKAELSQHEWADMVTRCRGCAWGDRCAHWLEQHNDTASSLPPNACLNKEKLNKISAATQEAL